MAMYPVQVKHLAVCTVHLQRIPLMVRNLLVGMSKTL